jgi:hypothetical protein
VVFLADGCIRPTMHGFALAGWWWVCPSPMLGEAVPRPVPGRGGIASCAVGYLERFRVL